MHKIGTALGCLLLIGAFAAPVAFAHYDTGSHPVPYATTGQDTYGYDDKDCTTANTDAPINPTIYNENDPQGMTIRGSPPNCGPGGVVGDVAPGSVFAANKDRVSGWYYGSTNTYTGLESDWRPNPLGGPLAACTGLPNPAPTTFNTVTFCQAVTGPQDPSFFAAQWGGLYDAEVGGLGDCGPGSTEGANEKWVNGNANPNGNQPDGLWNDGGHGAVGHTFGHYSCAAYEAPLGTPLNPRSGCDNYDQAFAEDAVGGEDVWIGAVCSWGVPTGGVGPTLDQVIVQFVGDVINCPLGGFPTSCTDAIQYLDDCSGLKLIAPNTTNCGVVGGTIVCGAGDISDIDFGRGQGSDGLNAVDPGTTNPTPPPTVTWPGVNSNSATYPNAGTDSGAVNCDSVATASAFPFTAVVVTQNNASPVGQVGIGHVSAATYGWIA